MLFLIYYFLYVFIIKKWNLKTPGRELKTATAGIKGKTADNNSSSDCVVGDTHRIQAIIIGISAIEEIKQKLPVIKIFILMTGRNRKF